MNATNKAKGQVERIKGKGKKAVGKIAGSKRLTEEGKGDQAQGSLKQAGEKAKDAARKVKKAVKDSTKD